ncbi:hypothetical protein B9Z55_028752 [Caenorhabditis nigoni]|uniref:Uncharacterized protein n=1 Tax=Caenorhabditis nigoni TaxID=1611254 RepID=A0A2G5SAB4_9PELO|nr:hypothetical protein B9Z55_028752 [Caenorhabditis nigoni]
MIAEISSGCVNFNVSNAPIVEKSDEDSGFKIGFKESFTSEGKTYNYDITELEMENSIKWKIVLICPEDSYPFTRGEIDVCVSIRFFPDSKICQNQTMGEKLCIESGDLGLTGPYSDEERDFFGEKLSTYESDFQNVNFWIDGKRDDASSPYTFSDSSISSTNGYGTIQDKAGNCYFLATRDGVQGVIYNHE